MLLPSRERLQDPRRRMLPGLPPFSFVTGATRVENTGRNPLSTLPHKGFIRVAEIASLRWGSDATDPSSPAVIP